MKMAIMPVQDFVNLLPKGLRVEVQASAKNIEIFFHNPANVHEQRSSFIMVVIRTKKLGRMYCGVAKCCPGCDDFNYEEGLKIAAKRAWLEFKGHNPGYGKEAPSPKIINPFWRAYKLSDLIKGYRPWKPKSIREAVMERIERAHQPPKLLKEAHAATQVKD